MYKFLVRTMIRRNIAALNRGDPGPLLTSYAADAVLVFPGTSSWGGEHKGRAAIEAFLRRFIGSGLTGQVHDILVNGPPWRTRVCVLFSDRAADDTGNTVYENRAVLYGRVVWGRLVYQEDFEDTGKVEIFDRYLAQHRQSA
jgi:ketosteroid isomerase-like protein